MNHREPPLSSGRVRRALHGLSLLLLPAMATEGLYALSHGSSPHTGAASQGAEPTPYLPVAGPPPLRFQEPAPPPDLVMRPAAAAPPTPALTPTESSVALANAAAARSTALASEPELPPAVAPTAEKPAPKETPAPPAKTPPPILRDDIRPAVRPEDFLPYFQIPGSAQTSADVTLLAPAPKGAPTPATLPPSSATYRQTSK